MRVHAVLLVCLPLLPLPCFAAGATALRALSTLADVKEVTTGFTLNQTAADSYAEVRVLDIPSPVGPSPSAGIFFAASQSSISLGSASAEATAVAFLAWESGGTRLTVQPTTATAGFVSGTPASALAEASAAIRGNVKSTRSAAPSPASLGVAQTEIVPVLFSIQFQDVRASSNETLKFNFGADFPERIRSPRR